MKFSLVLLCFSLFSAVLLAEEAACPGGICLLPEVSVTENASGAEDGEWLLVRKAEGLMNEGEFLRFLGDEPQELSWRQWNPFWLSLLVLLAGIALNLTPCVLPMIPVNLLIIGAGGGGRRGAWRGFCYGAGMAAAYGTLGLLAAFAGIGFGTLNGSPAFQIGAGLLFLLLAIFMTGILPLSFFSRFHVDARKWNGGPASVFLLGVFAALMAGACVSPVVAAVLLFTAATFQSGRLWVVILPFLLGIGMALPWPLAAAGIAILPKPGRKMMVVKYLLAAMVAAMGIWFCATGVRAFLPSGKLARSAEESFSALKEGMVLARQKNLPLLVEFYASWCKNCLAMGKTTLEKPEIRAVLERDFVFVSFAAEDPSVPAVRELLERWKITGFPAFVILRPSDDPNFSVSPAMPEIMPAKRER